MKTFTVTGGVFNKLHDDVDFRIEAAKLDFALELKRMMEQNEIKNVDLAERLGVSKPMVSKLLRGDANATIETMVKASKAVGGEFFIKIVRDNCTARIFEVVKAEQQHHRAPEAKKLKNFPTNALLWESNLFVKANGNEKKSIAA
jgi:transcriptional regulator with XRE-family HTH domain